MKRLLFFLFAIYALSLYSQDSTKVPVISFSETEHEFGTIVEGDTAIHVFKFTNTGTDTLRIKGVRPG